MPCILTGYDIQNQESVSQGQEKSSLEQAHPGSRGQGDGKGMCQDGWKYWAPDLQTEEGRPGLQNHPDLKQTGAQIPI